MSSNNVEGVFVFVTILSIVKSYIHDNFQLRYQIVKNVDINNFEVDGTDKTQQVFQCI